MPNYRIQNKYKFPVLVYEAPVDEKTEEIRKAFDVDEKTGYPREYNWRPLSRLGQTYRPEDVFYKLGDYRKEAGYATKLAIVCFTTFVACFSQGVASYMLRRPVYSKPQYPLIGWLIGTYGIHWIHEKTLEREARKNAIYIDYMRKHPDRFDSIYRPKIRELLYWAVPLR